MKSTLILIYGLTVLFSLIILMVKSNSSISTESALDTPTQQLNPSSIQQEISLIENQLEDLQVVQKMNSNTATPEERMSYETLFVELNGLRERLLNLKIETIKSKLAAYQREHSHRLSRYGISKKEYLN